MTTTLSAPIPPASTPGRCTVQSQEIGDQTIALRCLDWDRDRFDIEFDLDNGTTYNSFIIQGEKTALVDTSHIKFQDLYQAAIAEHFDLSQLDYLVVSHTEPDHSGLIKDILAVAPQVTIVGAKVAIQFLENMVHEPFQSQQVKQGDRLDLGQGHELTFISAPNLHWPDTILTYDAKTQILFTCDVFGMHYCNDLVYDDELDLLVPHFQYYYDCLMGPNARSVLSALKRMAKFNVQTIATGHGPLLRNHIPQWLSLYRNWSEGRMKTSQFAAVFYEADYGHGELLAQAIARGIIKSGVEVECIDLGTAETHDIRDLVQMAQSIVVGMPAQSNQANARAALSTILTSLRAKQSIGLFESGGGEDEPIYPLRNSLQEIGLIEAFPPILVKQAPDQSLLQHCEEAGTDLGQWLTRDRTIKKLKAIDTDLERALGRLSGGLYILTAQKDGVASAMLASWVTQASLEPLGVAVAVAKDRAIESLLQVGDRFVLNILEEDNVQHLMRHFLKRFPPGSDRFEGVKVYPAQNGANILADALAYLECHITHRLDCNDHWLIYSEAEVGRVSKLDALTAVHRRKVGNHY
ncbi:MAG: diflavin flavoprotein [Spirulinaceae cyanobacterium]